MATKAETLAAHQRAYDELRAAFGELSEREATERFYGTWGVREIVAHVAGWHEQLGEGLARIARGERPTPEGADWSDVEGWNGRFADEVKEAPFGDAVTRLDRAVAALRAAADRVAEDRYGEGKTVNRMIDGAGIEHMHAHAADIRAWRERRVG